MKKEYIVGGGLLVLGVLGFLYFSNKKKNKDVLDNDKVESQQVSVLQAQLELDNADDFKPSRMEKVL
jgi:uncharacterized membrane protein YebE (DUF533 family)